MKKTTFVPSPDQLEGRIVLSGGPKFSNGAAILTQNALGQTYSLIQKAFNQFANHGQNSNRLQADLATAVNRVPYNVRDGLRASVQAEASQMVTDVSTGTPFPVKSAVQRALSDVKFFVQSEVASGVIVMGSQVQSPTPQVAVSGGPKFMNGAAVLTKKALGQTYNLVQKAFTKYATGGQNINRLQADLAKAVNRIPYNVRDGLLAAVQSEMSQMVTDVSTSTPLPVRSALQRALNDVNGFVQSEVASGIIVVR